MTYKQMNLFFGRSRLAMRYGFFVLENQVNRGSILFLGYIIEYQFINLYGIILYNTVFLFIRLSYILPNCYFQPVKGENRKLYLAFSEKNIQKNTSHIIGT